MKTLTKPFLRAFLWGLTALCFALPAAAFDMRAGEAWVYDMTTDTVLLDKNAEAPMPPASMSKLMTINMLFEALKDGRVTLDTQFGVSSKAKSMTEQGGSTMYLQETDRPTVDELIHGMIINSGNDACVVVAEGLAGSEESFATLMTKRAKALGLEQSTFANASGWPDPAQRMSMRDLGMLAKRLIEVFPEYYPVFSQTEFNYKDRAPANANNRNPLLKLGIGADGLKTGHTEEAGFGIVGSVKQGERRIIFVLNGMASEKERAEEAERVANWAFREFIQKTVAKKGTKIMDAPVWMGSTPSVGLVVKEDLTLLLPSLVQDKLKAEVKYSGPINAPFTAGTEVAQMVIDIPGHAPVTVPLVAETDVAKGGFGTHVKTAFGIMARRLLDQVGS